MDLSNNLTGLMKRTWLATYQRLAQTLVTRTTLAILARLIATKMTMRMRQ